MRIASSATLVSLVKMSVFALLLWWVAQLVDYRQLWQTLHRLSPLTIGGIVLYQVGQYVCFGWRVRYAAWLSGLHLPLLKSIQWEFEILFLELILPVPDAEDFFRVLLWKEAEADSSKNLSAIIFSRLCGLLALSTLTPLTLLCAAGVLHLTGSVWHYLLALLPFGVVMLVWWLPEVLSHTATLLQRLPLVPAALIDLLHKMALVKHAPYQYIKGSLVALLYVLCLSGSYYVVLVALSVPVSFIWVVLFAPFLILAFMLPLSPQGLGLPQAAMGWMLLQQGVHPATATAVGVVHFAAYLVVVLLGGIFVLASNHQWPAIKTAWSGHRS